MMYDVGTSDKADVWIKANEVGESVVYLFDRYNTENFDSVVVYVSPPASLTLYPKHVEVEVLYFNINVIYDV